MYMYIMYKYDMTYDWHMYMFNTLICTNIYVYIYIYFLVYIVSQRDLDGLRLLFFFWMLRLFNIYVDVSRHT